MQAYGDGALAGADEFAADLLLSTHGVDVEAVLGGRAEAGNDLDFGAGNRDQGAVAGAVVHGECGDGGRGGDVGQDASAVDGAFEHETILLERLDLAQAWVLVRFFQSGVSADRYGERMKKILVTGATGKVGSRLSRRLAQRGDQVRALVRDRGRAAELHDEGIELVEGDLLNADSLAAAVSGIDVVVHCAAFFRGASAEEAHAVNDLGTRHLAHAARGASVGRFIFTSTGLVYGSTGGRLASEDDACVPTVAYPESKLAAERFLLGMDGLDVRVLRLPFVYGDGDPHIADIIPIMRGFPPSQRLSLGHHADIAQAVARLIDAPSPAHRIYNVVDDEAPDLATLFASVGAAAPDGSDAERARAFDALMDGRRIRADLGFKPLFPRLADAMAAGA